MVEGSRGFSRYPKNNTSQTQTYMDGGGGRPINKEA